jgi:beta-lactamase regulating signal transducer with metallopeptidase domain
MTAIQYYLFVNVFIMIFWVFYRIFLKNFGNFKSIRLYLKSAVILSLLLPLFQSGITELLSSGRTSVGSISQNLPLVGFIYNYSGASTQASAGGLSWLSIFEVLIFLGAVITGLFYLVNHFRILFILRRAEEQLISVDTLRVVKSEDIDIPFIYNDCIVLPVDISEEEISLVIEHEVLHHRYGHRFDNILFSVYHIIFWINPFFHLLKSALKLNHEYQVDGQILTSGTDPLFYKLSLIKYSVGVQKFSEANKLSSRNIKNRLLMMNSTCLNRGSWRYILIIPITSVFLAAFCVACIQPGPQQVKQEVHQDGPLIEASVDSIEMEIIDITRESLQDKNRDVTLVVLMNRSSSIMIAGDKDVVLENAEDKIISEYNKNIDKGLSNTWVVVHKDVAADPDEYQKLLDAIGTAQYKLRNIQANRQFGMNYNLLPLTEKEMIRELIPFKIYRQFPDK